MRRLIWAMAAFLVFTSTANAQVEGADLSNKIAEVVNSSDSASDAIASLLSDDNSTLTAEQKTLLASMDVAAATTFLESLASGLSVADAVAAAVIVSTGDTSSLVSFAKAVDPSSSTEIDNSASASTAAGGATGTGNTGNTSPGIPVGAGNGNSGSGGGGNTGSDN